MHGSPLSASGWWSLGRWRVCDHLGSATIISAARVRQRLLFRRCPLCFCFCFWLCLCLRCPCISLYLLCIFPLKFQHVCLILRL